MLTGASCITQIILIVMSITRRCTARCLSALMKEELMDHAIASGMISCVKRMETSVVTL